MQLDDVSIVQQIVSSIRRILEENSTRIFLVQINTELKNLANQNNEILHEINRCDHDLQKYEEKLQILDNMTQLATQSLEMYFQTVGEVS